MSVHRRFAAIGLALLFLMTTSVGHALADETDTAERLTNTEPKTIQSRQTLRDPEIRVESRKLGLRRQVEMLQWERDGDGFVKVWRDAPVVSGDVQHSNPPMPKLQNAVWLASDANRDGQQVDPGVLMALGQWIRVRPGFSRVPFRWSRRFQPDGDGLSDSDNPLNPQVGDVRMFWSELFVPTLERQVILADGKWQLPGTVQLDEATVRALNRQLQDAQQRRSLRDLLSRMWTLAAFGLLTLLIVARVVLIRRARHNKARD